MQRLPPRFSAAQRPQASLRRRSLTARTTLDTSTCSLLPRRPCLHRSATTLAMRMTTHTSPPMTIVACPRCAPCLSSGLPLTSRFPSPLSRSSTRRPAVSPRVGGTRPTSGTATPLTRTTWATVRPTASSRASFQGHRSITTSRWRLLTTCTLPRKAPLRPARLQLRPRPQHTPLAMMHPLPPCRLNR